MKVQELIDHLKTFDADAEVRCLAACCSHAHPITGVSDAFDEREKTDLVVVLDARE
jgi:hypothetical protein